MESENTKILLIEDNPGDARLIQKLLYGRDKNWCDVIRVGRLSAGLKHLVKGKFDIILLDLGLPDSQGVNTFLEVFNQASDTPILILSGNVEVEIAVQTLQQGAQDYLVKGEFDGNILHRALQYALERHRIKSELRQRMQEISVNRALIQKIIDETADGIVIVDQKGIARFINPAATKIFNRKTSAMIDQLIGFPLEAGKPTELDIFPRRGVRRRVEISTVEIQWEGEKAYLAALRDITERKQMEESLRESEERAKAQYKGMPVPTTTWEQRGHNLVLVDCNDAAMETSQGKIIKFLGKTAKVLFADTPEILKDLIGTFKTKSTIMRDFACFLKILNTKGYFSFSYVFIPPNMVMQHVEDITKRKEAEEALKNEKEFIEIIIETANSLIIGLNKQGNIVFFNKKCEDLIGSKREDAIGKNWFETFIPDSHQEAARQIFSQTSEEIITNFIHPIKTKKGERIIWWHNTPVKREQDQLVITIGIDITEEEKSRKRIEELNKSLRLIIHILGHDVLNDFHAIKLALNVMELESNKEALQIALNNVDTSVRLIKKMRELENLVTQGGELELYQMSDVIKEVIPAYSMNPVKITVMGDCKVLANGAINSVIDNIIQNAIIHGKTDRIKIDISQKNGWGEIRIIDFGIGIPDEIKANIFEEGFKYGKTAHSGLGLYIVKSFVEKYEGEIYVEDNKPKGCIFIIKLKCAEDATTN